MFFFFLMIRRPPISTLTDTPFPYTTLFRSKPIGLGARDSLRLEAGLPLYGHDLDENTDPATAGLGFAISKRRRSEGGFPGATRILALLTEGAPVKRVGLSLEGRMPARDGATIFHDGQAFGTVTSGGFGPRTTAPIANNRKSVV